MTSFAPVLPVLVHIQANLDGDLSLEALANRAAYSPYHFHRMFRATVGESLKDYTLRLRLERAAFRLLLHAGSLLDVASESGFRSHASFTRAFSRHFATTPSAYRRAGRKRWAAARGRRSRPMDLSSSPCEVSQTRLVALRSTHLAFIRHVGSYETVSEKLWEELLEWAAPRRLPGPPVLFGIGHDSPETTPAERLRFDAALRVTGPFPADGRIGYQELAAGDFAVTTHVGHYSTLGAAYRLAFERLLAMRGVHVIGLPAVEVYQETRIDPSHTMNHTDIYIPVGRR